MKRILLTALFVLLAKWSFAAGTCTESFMGGSPLNYKNVNTECVKIACTADAATGALPDESVTNVGGNLMSVCLDWGATAPTSGAYDIYVKADSMADIDLLGGVGVNLATGADLCLTPLVGAAYSPISFFGNITVSQAGNVVNSATPTAYLCFRR